MSYLARISARATGSRSKVPAIMPKGMANRHPPRIARMDEDDEKEETLAPMRTSGAPPLRRQDEEGESEEVPTVVRKEQTGPEELQAGEEEVAALRRTEEEGEEDAIQPIRREDVEEEEENEVMAMRAIARQEEIPLEESPKPAPPPRQSDLEPDAGPVSDDLAGEQEPSDLQALRRSVSPGPAPSPATPQTEALASGPQAGALTPFQTGERGFSTEFPIAELVPPTTGMDAARPTVVIDRLDVLIHEPMAQGTRAAPREDRQRALRARYLRRL